MANPYKNTNRAGTSPFKQTDRLTEIQDMKDRLNKKIPYNSTTPLADDKRFIPIVPYDIPKGEMVGSAGALEWIGPGGALKLGKGIFNVASKLWNMGRKGGYGYANPVATGRNLDKIIQKKIGGKAVEFKKFGGYKVTPSDIAKAKSLTTPYKVAGTVGRTAAIGGGIAGIVNYGDSGYSEINEAVVKHDQIYDKNKTYADEINKRNQPFETPKEDEKNK